jgi:integrase
MATAKKRGSGKYRVRIYDYTDLNGKKIYRSFTASTKKEAELLAAQYKAGRTHASDLLSVEQCMDEYIQLKTAVLSPSTIKKYKDIKRILMRTYPAFMQKRVNTLKQNDLQALVSDLALSKSPKTVKNYYGLLTAISDQIKLFKVTLPQIIAYEPYIPSEDEILTILNYVKGKEIELPIILASNCMMRRGEICGLSVDDVNFKNKTIHIRHSMVLDDERKWVNKAPKTKKSDRIIKVPEFVLELIKKKGCITTYNPDTLTDTFEEVLSQLELHHFRFHDLRHYCASVFHYKGIPMSYTQKYGGWSTMDTLLKIYQHTLPDKEDEIFNQMNDYFSEKYDPKYDPTPRKAL